MAAGRVARAALAVGALCGLWCAAALGASPAVETELDATLKPDRLPKRGSAPTTLELSGRILGERPPRLREVGIGVNRLLTLSPAGAATCRPGDLTAKTIKQARKNCGRALIGTGSVNVAFAVETARLDSRQTVLLFNGGKGKVLVYTYQPPAGGFVPAAAAIVTTGNAGKHYIQLPLASVGGGVTGFRFRIGRTWHRHGRTLAYLRGQCGKRTLASRVGLEFEAGASQASTVTAACRPR